MLTSKLVRNDPPKKPVPVRGALMVGSGTVVMIHSAHLNYFTGMLLHSENGDGIVGKIYDALRFEDYQLLTGSLTLKQS